MISIMLLVVSWAIVFVSIVGVLSLVDFARNVKNDFASESFEYAVEFNQQMSDLNLIHVRDWSDPHARFRPKF